MIPLESQIRSLLLDIRNLHHMIYNPNFEDMYLECDPDLQGSIDQLIRGSASLEPFVRSSCLTTLKEIIKVRNFRDASIRDLREQARVLYIPRYSRLSKAELLSEIARATDVESYCLPDCGEVHPDQGSPGQNGDVGIKLHLQPGQAGALS